MTSSSDIKQRKAVNPYVWEGRYTEFWTFLLWLATVSALIIAMTNTIDNSSQAKLSSSLLGREKTVFARSKSRLKLLIEIDKILTNHWQRCRVYDAFPTPPAAEHGSLFTPSNSPAADDENKTKHNRVMQKSLLFFLILSFFYVRFSLNAERTK